MFLDEIDKIASREDAARGPDVSREGVQRDLLPIVEGTTVTTKYGAVRTDHVLFIAAGAFHVARPSDLIPEMQGRFPIRVELTALDAADFERILIEPENSLIRQYTELLATEGVSCDSPTAPIERAGGAGRRDQLGAENIGARRLLHGARAAARGDLVRRPGPGGEVFKVTGGDGPRDARTAGRGPRPGAVHSLRHRA